MGKPIKTFKVGALEASVWDNQTAKGTMKKVVLSKRYKTANSPRYRQQYRRELSGLERHPKGRKPKNNATAPRPPQPGILKDRKGRIFVLS